MAEMPSVGDIAKSIGDRRVCAGRAAADCGLLGLWALRCHHAFDVQILSWRFGAGSKKAPRQTRFS
jgi:hypothetical protein